MTGMKMLVRTRGNEDTGKNTGTARMSIEICED